MKKLNLLSMALIAVLMVFAVGCTTLQESAGGGYEEVPGRRVYRQSPYGNNQVIVVERDPFTGQYYQVGPYGNLGGAPYNTFGYGYPRGGYGYPSNRGGYYRGGGASTNRGRITNQPAPRAQQPAQRGSETTRKAKDVILGN